MADHSKLKLGMKPRTEPLIGVRKFSDVLPYAAAPGAHEANWFANVRGWPMLLNDQIGDCVPACMGHVIQQWTTYTDANPIVMTDQEIVEVYSAIGGYVPGNPATDQGCMVSDALRYWAVTGMPTPDGGPDVLAGFAEIVPADLSEIRRAIAETGNVVAGVQLPISAQTEDVWSDTTGAPGSWGGHCVPLVGFDVNGPICVTWGCLKRMTWAWWQMYAAEAYALLSHDWMRVNGADPASVDWNQLEADMRTFAMG